MMNNSISFKTILNQLLPYLLIGLGLVVAYVMLVFISYLLVWGFTIGLCIWAFMKVQAFFSKKMSNHTPYDKGRTIEHRD